MTIWPDCTQNKPWKEEPGVYIPEKELNMTRRTRAFTLVELMVVISIIDTLALQFGFSGGVLIRPRGG